MTALELSREFFLETALLDLREKFPDIAERAAAGLAGNGSECFGYDDEWSRDHDWGVDFFLWLPSDCQWFLPALTEWKAEICEKIPAEYRKQRSAYGANVGVMTVESFFQSLIGCPGRPKTLQEWLRAPEEQLAMCVNGAVFHEGDGGFSRIQNEIRQYYPADIRLKRIASALMVAAQAGQYNALRMAKRFDWVTVQESLSRYVRTVIRLVFLLNQVYRPYYKWAFRGMCELPILGQELGRLLTELTLVSGFDTETMRKRETLIETIAGKLITELRRQGLSDETDGFLTVHGESVRKRIQLDTLRELPARYDPFPD